MTARRTRCLTSGEERTAGSPIVNANGRVTGFVDWSDPVILCGRDHSCDDDYDLTGYDSAPAPLPRLGDRPKGVCRACWRAFVKDCAESRAEELQARERPKVQP